MAYEYESRLKNRLLDLEFDTWKETAQFEREYRELQEVYRKAKAFDEILNIEDNYNKEKGFSPCVEEYTEEVEDIISKYMEDKQND
ncbi:hypothetical protein MXL22_00545 [Staphylococcus pseudoxylosus]|uniref:hypothetical protein n=1 Tax=Staphylococcus pseudoxylosus TaxID=2282419 RepID=UPI002DBB352E|nr:hypothetical protein [Staphylococcus pseudoxylosus]MEB6059571.1 hypothetical protein [Staphylococcus pseudoxylosus]